jgi:hypothetical protein
MFCSDAVFAATVFAGADHGHGKAPVFPTTLAVLCGGFASGISGAATVADGELVARVRGEELGYEAESLGEGLRGEEGVLAFA